MTRAAPWAAALILLASTASVAQGLPPTSSSPALAGRTQKVLVGTTATAMPQLGGRRGMLFENRGPNPIWCALSASAAAVGEAHKVASGERLAFNGPDQWWCIAETAAQVAYNSGSPSTTGPTVVSEVQ